MEKRFYSVKEISFYLSLNEITIRRLIDQGKIPARKIGRSVRVDKKELDVQLENQGHRGEEE